MPWATDLLPHEIDAKKIAIKQRSLLKKRNLLKYVGWVGSVCGGSFGNQSEIDPFITAARHANIKFSHKTKLNPKETERFLERAYMAPTIVGEWQKKQGYIPCRIFKNCSYGQMGITNSYRVYELFNKKIVYDSDPGVLFSKAQHALTSFDDKEREELMDFVKEKHTYISRIHTLLNFIDKVKQQSN
jgi:hypothetical protein